MLDRIRSKIANYIAPDTAAALPPMEAKQGDLRWDDDAGWTLLTGSREDAPRTFVELVLSGFRKNPVVSACTRQLVTSLSEAPIAAFRETSEGDELIENHDAARVMQRPNERDSYVEFVERTGSHYLIGGNTFWKKMRLGSGRVDGLTPIRPDRVISAITDADDIPLGWRIVKGTGEEIVEADDMVHIPDIDPLDPVFGIPRLLAAALEIRTDNSASDYVAEILQNHGFAGLLVGVDKTSSETQMLRLEDKLTERYGPEKGRGRIGVVRNVGAVKEIGFNLQHLEFPDLRRISREGICTVYGVDPMLVGIGSASRGGTLSGAELRIALEILWKQTLIPLARRWESAMNAFLAPEWGDIKLKFVFDDVEALQPDRDKNAERAVKMVEAGVYTDQEIRAETGHEPEPGEGNVIRKIAVVAIPDGGRAEPPGRNGDQEGSAGNGKKLLLSGEEVPRLHLVASPWWVDEQRRAAWKSFDQFAEQQEPGFQNAALQLLEDERRELVKLAKDVLRERGLKDLGPVVAMEAKGVTPESLAEFRRRLGDRFDAYHADWAARFEALIGETVELVGEQVAADLGIAFDVLSPEVVAFIQGMANNLSGDVTAATFEAIRLTFEEGIRAGEGITPLAQRIDDVFGQGLYRTHPRTGKRFQLLNSQQRARLIARTTATTATNGGALATVRSSDAEVEKEWITQGDDRVREEHEAMEGERVGRDEEFSNGLDHPSEPNCRCGILLHPVRRRRSSFEPALEAMQRRKWSRDAAAAWLKDHGYKTGRYEKMANWHSFRQREPSRQRYMRFRNDMSWGPPGAMAVMGIRRSDGKAEVQSARFYHGEGGED